MGKFGSWQSVENLCEIYDKVLFCKTYIEVSNINQKPLIWSQDIIITKFGQKNVILRNLLRNE